MYVILYFDPHVFVFASWSIPFHTSTKQNFRFSDPISFKEINCLPLRIRLFMTQETLKS